jgi:hypothetical protein
MIGSKKMSSIRNTLVGQSVNISAVRKIGQPAQKPLFVKKEFKNLNLKNNSLKIAVFYIIL